MARDGITDPELKLLVELCGLAIVGDRYAAVGTSCDWRRLVSLARRHRVQGLAWVGLTGGTESEFPSAPELLEEAKSIARDNLLAVAAAARLSEEFNRRGLKLLFLKGLTLGSLVYPNSMLKMSTDVDVLVDANEIEAAERCLESLGYERDGTPRTQSRRAAAAKEWSWVGRDGVVIDLHVRLTDNPALLPKVGVRSSSTQNVEVSPGIVLPTLQREELFAYLCVHGTWSAWFRLKWVADLAALLHRCGTDEIRNLYRDAQAHQAGRCPDVALLVVENLFGPLVPGDLLTRAARDPLARLLAGLSIRELVQVREPLERPLGTLAIHFAELFVERGFAFPIHELRRQFSSLLG